MWVETIILMTCVLTFSNTSVHVIGIAETSFAIVDDLRELLLIAVRPVAAVLRDVVVLQPRVPWSAARFVFSGAVHKVRGFPVPSTSNTARRDPF